jgi:hypothetical protein
MGVNGTTFYSTLTFLRQYSQLDRSQPLNRLEKPSFCRSRGLEPRTGRFIAFILGRGMITRRQALASMGCLGAGFGASACSTITPFCPTDPTISDPSTPLTIDAHTHVFNGSDLQIEGFFTRILAANDPSLQGFGEILQELGRDFAPTANEEIAELGRIDVVLRACDLRGSAQIMDSYRQAGYGRAVYGLKAALRRARTRRPGRTPYISPEIERQIGALPETISEYKASRLRKLRLSPQSISVMSMSTTIYLSIRRVKTVGSTS